MAKTAVGAPLVHKAGPGESNWLNDLPTKANPNYAVYFNDFMTAQDYNTTNEWNQVKDTSATVAIRAAALLGTVVLTSATTTDNDGAYIGLNQENYRLTSGKKLWFSTRVQVAATPADMDFFVGLSEAVATNPENVIADTTHRIGFQLVEGSADLIVKTSNGTTASTPTMLRTVTVASATYYKFDIVWDGLKTIEYYVNNSLVARSIVGTDNLPASTDALTPGVFELSGNATDAFSATVDYIMVAVER